MKDFQYYSIKDFNFANETKLTADMTWYEALDELDEEDVRYFYISLDPDDVLEAIEEEVAEALDLSLVCIEELGIYLATY